MKLIAYSHCGLEKTTPLLYYYIFDLLNDPDNSHKFSGLWDKFKH